MHALSRKGIQIGGKGGNESLTLARFHFGNTALMQKNAAEQLHEKGSFAQNARVCLADGSKGLH